jgi:hypothetical protein
MDRSGDTRHSFDPKDDKALKDAEERFYEVTGKGFRAVAFSKEGEPATLLHRFDAHAERILFIPQLQGG